MSLREQWIRPLDALPQDYQHVIAITSSGQEEEMYLVDDKWHIVDGVRIPIESVVFWHEKREQPTVEMAEDCVSREAVLEQAIDYGSKTFLIPVNSVKALPSVQPQPKRGHWIGIDATHNICDKCEAIFEITSPDADVEINFCPSCGVLFESEMQI